MPYLCSCHCHVMSMHTFCIFVIVSLASLSSHCSSLSSQCTALMSFLCSCHCHVKTVLCQQCRILNFFIMSTFIFVISIPLMSFLCSCHCHLYTDLCHTYTACTVVLVSLTSLSSQSSFLSSQCHLYAISMLMALSCHVFAQLLYICGHVITNFVISLCIFVISMQHVIFILMPLSCQNRPLSYLGYCIVVVFLTSLSSQHSSLSSQCHLYHMYAHANYIYAHVFYICDRVQHHCHVTVHLSSQCTALMSFLYAHAIVISKHTFVVLYSCQSYPQIPDSLYRPV